MDLNATVATLPYVGPNYARYLEKLGVFTILDLLNHIPSRYIDYTNVVPISKAVVGQVISIKGHIDSFKVTYTRRMGFTIQKALVSDSTGTMEVVWYNQRFLKNTLSAGINVSLSGTTEMEGGKVKLVSPDWEIITPGKSLIHTGRLVPVYPETKGISSKWLRARISSLLSLNPFDEDYLPNKLRESEALIDIADAYQHIHFPSSMDEVQLAKNRLAFDELLFVHLKSIQRKTVWQKNKIAKALSIKQSVYKQFTDNLNFDLTSSQTESIKEILTDMGKPTPMNRLLEGDVGSGKTVVAAAGAFASFINGTQSIIMAPTQILASQHYNTLSKLFEPFKVRVSLLTSSAKIESLGKTDIYVGTHALIHKKVKFDNVSLVVIDEQHRFGVEQRAHLISKAGKRKLAPHVLTMTATPIPRTIALTLYGDLDLSILTDMPKGRKVIKTWVVPETKRESAFSWLEKQIKEKGDQVYVVCPLIEESSIETMKQVHAAKEEFEVLKKLLPNCSFGLLHGRMKAKEKDTVLDKFRSGELDILVSTPVVEVGLDVANASVMLIETADRFGLAQLHQLRGRVGRGDKQSYCLLFAKGSGKTAYKRLKAMETTNSGFELAELDMKLRGPGEVFGTRQHGFPELKIANWADTGLIKTTRSKAEEITANPKLYQNVLDIINKPAIAPN